MKKKQWVERNFGAVALGVFMLMVTLALPAWGQQLEWAIQAGGPETDSGRGIAADGEGNSYVTGNFSGTAVFGIEESNETIITSFGVADIFVAKYAGDGSLLWARQAGGAEIDSGRGIATDGEGNSYVTGTFSGTAVFGVEESNETELTSFGDTDIFVAKYAGDGSLLWAQQAGGAEIDSGRGIAADGAGNIYVTGTFSGTVTFGTGEANQTVLTSFGDTDIFVAKYAGDGSLHWAQQAGGAEIDSGRGIAADGAGNIYVTGGFKTATFGPGEASETVLTGFGDTDIFVAKYAGDGSLLWAQQAGGSGSIVGDNIAADGEGNSYVTGAFVGSIIFGSGEANQTVLNSLAFDEEETFVAKYADDGSLLWAKQASGISDGNGIAVDGTGNSYVTGEFTGSIIFGPGEANQTVLTKGDPGAFLAKYDGSGQLLWARQAGEGTTFGNDIAVDGAGNSYVIGAFGGSIIFGSGEASETVLTDFGQNDIFVAKYTENIFQNLIDMIEGFNLKTGLENSLLDKLRNAREATESPNAEQRRNAANILAAFINAVKAQSGKALTEEQADQLIDLAEQILAGLQ